MRRLGRGLGRLLGVVLGLYLLTLAAIVAVDGFWPRDGLPEQASAIICLGGGAAAERLGAESRARVARCVELFEEGVAPVILMTGAAAAPLMAEMATAQGVPAEAVGVEAISRSTLQNALYSGRLVDPTGPVVVVSNAYHLPRSWLSFRVMGFGDMRLAAAPMEHAAPRSLFREAMAVWFNAGRAGLWLVTPWLDPDLREALLI